MANLGGKKSIRSSEVSICGMHTRMPGDPGNSSTPDFIEKFDANEAPEVASRVARSAVSLSLPSAIDKIHIETRFFLMK